jgi:nucleoid-associated protein YgaU
MKIAFKALVFILSIIFVFSVDVMDRPSPGVALIREAQAVVGRPLTPLSYAGVARRTTRRAVATEAAVATTAAAAATASAAAAASAPPAAPAASAVPIGTVVQALPPGCTSMVVNGVSYSSCGGSFYKAAFEGNNLVYVVVPKPFN